MKSIRDKYYNEYVSAKFRAKELMSHRSYERALRTFEYVSSIAWHKPILKDFIDDELEADLNLVGESIISTLNVVPRESCGRRRAVFYNGQVIDNGALTEQYLHYLVSNEYEILFIVQSNAAAARGKKILKILQKVEAAKIVFLNESSRIGKIQELYNEVVSFSPELCFLHFMPNDVVGYTAFSQVEGCLRYYIVHNDHTFWLGKGCSDYFLEFRQYGVRLSIENRRISRDKVVNLPYYPINSGIEYQGLPFVREGKIVGLSGGILSKYFRDPELSYFVRIKNLIKEHPNFVFCLCGHGSVKQTEVIKEFVRKYGIQDQFYYLGHRSDFYSLVGEVDILFESYPQRGGLLVLFATNQGKAVVGVGSSNPAIGTTEQYLDVPNYSQPMSFDDFEIEASLLISDDECRKSNALKFKSTKYNFKDFNEKLSVVIEAGSLYRDPLEFRNIVSPPRQNSYDHMFNGEQSAEDFLCRAKARAFIDSVVLRCILDVFYVIRFDGVRILIRRLARKVSSFFT